MVLFIPIFSFFFFFVLHDVGGKWDWVAVDQLRAQKGFSDGVQNRIVGRFFMCKHVWR